MSLGASMWESVAQSKATTPPNVVSRAFARETVLLNIKSGQYHGIDRVGARFLAVLSEHPDLEAASRVLADEYAQPLERIQGDLAEFVIELRSRGLLELASD